MAHFITFEGIEGAGKSLQIGLLHQELERRHMPVLVTREPGGTALGLGIRALLLEREGPAREPESELLLYLADRYQHLREVIEPALAQGQIVLCDRYHDATVAYQGHARGLGMERIERLRRLLEIRQPDLTLWLDIDVEEGLARARQRETDGECGHDRFEMESLDFHRRVRDGYRQLLELYPDRVHRVDAAGSRMEVFERIRALLARLEILSL